MTVAISGATNVDPIVITTATPHGLVGNQPVLIEGVLGNTAANGTFQINYLSTTTFSIQAVGNGAYTSGGTVTGPLGPMVALIGILSTELAARLVTRGLSALKPNGQILLGSERVNENEAPNRIVFVPDTTNFGLGGPPTMGGIVGTGAAAIRASVERRAQLAARPLLEETLHFRVHIWGQASPPDSANDYDVTRALYHALLATIHQTTVGTFKFTKGTWTANNNKSDAQILVAGRELVLGVEWRTPVLADPYTFISSDTVPSTTVYIQPADGSPTETP